MLIMLAKKLPKQTRHKYPKYLRPIYLIPVQYKVLDRVLMHRVERDLQAKWSHRTLIPTGTPGC